MNASGRTGRGWFGAASSANSGGGGGGNRWNSHYSNNNSSPSDSVTASHNGNPNSTHTNSYSRTDSTFHGSNNKANVNNIGGRFPHTQNHSMNHRMDHSPSIAGGRGLPIRRLPGGNHRQSYDDSSFKEGERGWIGSGSSGRGPPPSERMNQSNTNNYRGSSSSTSTSPIHNASGPKKGWVSGGVASSSSSVNSDMATAKREGTGGEKIYSGWVNDKSPVGVGVSGWGGGVHSKDSPSRESTITGIGSDRNERSIRDYDMNMSHIEDTPLTMSSTGATSDAVCLSGGTDYTSSMALWVSREQDPNKNDGNYIRRDEASSSKRLSSTLNEKIYSQQRESDERCGRREGDMYYRGNFSLPSSSTSRMGFHGHDASKGDDKHSRSEETSCSKRIPSFSSTNPTAILPKEHDVSKCDESYARPEENFFKRNSVSTSRKIYSQERDLSINDRNCVPPEESKFHKRNSSSMSPHELDDVVKRGGNYRPLEEDTFYKRKSPSNSRIFPQERNIRKHDESYARYEDGFYKRNAFPSNSTKIYSQENYIEERHGHPEEGSFYKKTSSLPVATATNIYSHEDHDIDERCLRSEEVFSKRNSNFQSLASNKMYPQDRYVKNGESYERPEEDHFYRRNSSFSSSKVYSKERDVFKSDESYSRSDDLSYNRSYSYSSGKEKRFDETNFSDNARTEVSKMSLSWSSKYSNVNNQENYSNKRFRVDTLSVRLEDGGGLETNGGKFLSNQSSSVKNSVFIPSEFTADSKPISLTDGDVKESSARWREGQRSAQLISPGYKRLNEYNKNTNTSRYRLNAGAVQDVQDHNYEGTNNSTSSGFRELEQNRNVNLRGASHNNAFVRNQTAPNCVDRRRDEKPVDNTRASQPTNLCNPYRPSCSEDKQSYASFAREDCAKLTAVSCYADPVKSPSPSGNGTDDFKSTSVTGKAWSSTAPAIKRRWTTWVSQTAQSSSPPLDVSDSIYSETHHTTEKNESSETIQSGSDTSLRTDEDIAVVTIPTSNPPSEPEMKLSETEKESDNEPIILMQPLSPVAAPPSGLAVALSRLADVTSQMEFQYTKYLLLCKEHDIAKAQLAVLKQLPVGFDAFREDYEKFMESYQKEQSNAVRNDSTVLVQDI